MLHLTFVSLHKKTFLFVVTSCAYSDQYEYKPCVDPVGWGGGGGGGGGAGGPDTP